VFSLNEEGQLEHFAGFPIDLHDVVAEPSGRVVGFWGNADREQIYIQNAANGRFTALQGTDRKTIGVVSTAAWISGRRATLVGTSDGLFSLQGNDPIPTVRLLEVTGRAIRKVGWIGDLPLHQAAAVGTYGGSVFIINSDNSVREVPGFQIPSHNWVIRFSQLDHPDRLLIQANEELWTAPLQREGEITIPGRAHRITGYVFDGNVLQYYPAVQQYLVYGKLNSWTSPRTALLRLQDELTPVEGSVGLPDRPFIRNIPSRGIVAIETFSGLYTYDGKNAVKPIPGSTEAEIGKYPRIHDLAGQNKIIVMTISGLYELTVEGHLNRMPLPAELGGAKFNELAEMPASHLAVVFTDRGAFELDPAGRLSRIRGEHGIDFGTVGPSLVTRIPVRETLFVSTYQNGQFMILDEDKAGQGACAAAQ
jgi:hypothetical protein